MPVVFSVSTLACLILFGLASPNKMVVIPIVIWAFALSAVSSLNIFLIFPPTFVLVLVSALLLSISYYRLSKNLSLNAYYLLGIHIIRLPIEFIIFQLFKHKMLPIEMTFLGWNYDLFFGITAVLFLIFSSFNPKILTSVFFKAWNILGICSLLIVVVIGILSSPLPLQSMAFDQPNIAVLQFPYVLLPTIIVPIVILSHFHLMGNSAIAEQQE
ncbi:hypothetical protein [Sphingobacterium puteale]|nr:hypothetical protein [Sphingobacterium puteale]